MSNSFILAFGAIIFVVCAISIFLDLIFTNTALNIIRDMNHGTSSPFGTNLASSRGGFPQRVERLLSHRTIGRYVQKRLAAHKIDISVH